MLRFVNTDKNYLYSIGRMILTKAPWIFDPNGDKDRQDITSLYKAKEGKRRKQIVLRFASAFENYSNDKISVF